MEHDVLRRKPGSTGPSDIYLITGMITVAYIWSSIYIIQHTRALSGFVSKFTSSVSLTGPQHLIHPYKKNQKNVHRERRMNHGKSN